MTDASIDPQYGLFTLMLWMASMALFGASLVGTGEAENPMTMATAFLLAVGAILAFWMTLTQTPAEPGEVDEEVTES